MTVSKKLVKIRKAWLINPRTRVKESKKIYSRQKLKQEAERIIKNAQINKVKEE